MHYIVKHSVDAETYAKIFLIRLDVYIRCSATQAVDKQNVDETNDRSVFAGACKSGEIDLVVVFDDLKFLAFAAAELETVQRHIKVRFVKPVVRVVDLKTMFG